jgi:MerR family transcriptional regulator, thiopeptide resistance regulator
MEQKRQEFYRVHEFAAMAGVTVRTLHHYDRLGLLRPARHRDNGYRLYTQRDLGHLEQILFLKFLGLQLKQVRDLLKRESALPSVLRQQWEVLAQKRRQMDKTIEAVAAALQALEARGKPDWNLFKIIIKEIEMQNNTEWTGKYFSEEAKSQIEDRKKLWSPEFQEEVSKAWSELFQDVKSALGEDPAGPKAQEIAVRWRNLVEGFAGGNPEIQKGLNAMYADQPNWPAQRREAFGIPQEIRDFISKAMKAGAGK